MTRLLRSEVLSLTILHGLELHARRSPLTGGWCLSWIQECCGSGEFKFEDNFNYLYQDLLLD